MLGASTRREFLASMTVIAAAGRLVGGQRGPAGAIDTHTHFYDPTRPEGVPWPSKSDSALYRQVLPAEFKALAQPLGIVGTVVVEASPWLEDNQWVLDLVARDRFLLGLVGNLLPGRATFADELARFASNPRFLGIRVHGSDRAFTFDSPDVLRDLRLLADRDRQLDVLINTDRLVEVAGLAGAIPNLRIVIDHCANVRIDGGPPPAAWLAGLRACAPRTNLFMKVSGLVEGTGRHDDTAPGDLAVYQPTLDAVWETFGEDRVIYGGNWPVSAPFAPYARMHGIVQEYFRLKGPGATEKYFARNAQRVYRWPAAGGEVGTQR
jgi:L-fucono-1,5-lactonase